MLHIPRQCSGRMLGPRTKAQDRQKVGRPAVHGQAAGLRSDSARRVHHGSHELVERAIPEAVLAAGRVGMFETAGTWLRIG